MKTIDVAGAKPDGVYQCPQCRGPMRIRIVRYLDGADTGLVSQWHFCDSCGIRTAPVDRVDLMVVPNPLNVPLAQSDEWHDPWGD